MVTENNTINNYETRVSNLLQTFNKLKKVNIYEIHNYMDECDIIIYNGDCWLSESIKYFTDSPVSHVAFGAYYKTIPIIFESDKNVHTITLEESLKQGGRLFIARVSNINQDQKDKILQRAIKLCGYEYDWPAIKQKLLNDTLESDFFTNVDDNKYYCSEYLETCFNEIGLKFQRDKNNFSVPINIALDDRLVYICEIIL